MSQFFAPGGQGIGASASGSVSVSQETGEVVWYSHLFKKFPQFVVIHTVKGFNVVDEAEVDVFLELPCFLHDPTNVGNLIPGSSTSSKPSLYMGILGSNTAEA